MSTKNTKAKTPIRVAELFAGVGGFRVGFERASKRYETVWFNQWEPGETEKAQSAWRAYCAAFGLDEEGSRLSKTNTDISKVEVSDIPDHDLLVGGFPCQDYSVARTLSQSQGLKGKKGVLWWDIHRILENKKKKPSYLMLENVDRLLKSPAVQRGRDFAVMLATLSDLGYAVEWRVINAAEYGMPQRRRRVYILGYRKGTPLYKELQDSIKKGDCTAWLQTEGVHASTFPIAGFKKGPVSFKLEGRPDEITENFKHKMSPFENAGIMLNRNVCTAKIEPSAHTQIKLRDILHKPGEVSKEYLKPFEISADEIELWKIQKGAKSEERSNKKTGFTYKYTEGSMPFPDSLDKPSRTIVTGEGGKSPSRFKHVVEYSKGKYRRLTPVELERLNMFPDGHTAKSGASDTKRAFFMGNALVVGIVERLGRSLEKRGFE